MRFSRSMFYIRSSAVICLACWDVFDVLIRNRADNHFLHDCQNAAPVFSEVRQPFKMGLISPESLGYIGNGSAHNLGYLPMK